MREKEDRDVGGTERQERVRKRIQEWERERGYGRERERGMQVWEREKECERKDTGVGERVRIQECV